MRQIAHDWNDQNTIRILTSVRHAMGDVDATLVLVEVRLLVRLSSLCVNLYAAGFILLGLGFEIGLPLVGNYASRNLLLLPLLCTVIDKCFYSDHPRASIVTVNVPLLYSLACFCCKHCFSCIAAFMLLFAVV